jgi:hypothetical protein
VFEPVAGVRGAGGDDDPFAEADEPGVALEPQAEPLGPDAGGDRVGQEPVGRNAPARRGPNEFDRYGVGDGQGWEGAGRHGCGLAGRG